MSTVILDRYTDSGQTVAWFLYPLSTWLLYSDCQQRCHVAPNGMVPRFLSGYFFLGVRLNYELIAHMPPNSQLLGSSVQTNGQKKEGSVPNCQFGELFRSLRVRFLKISRSAIQQRAMSILEFSARTTELECKQETGAEKAGGFQKCICCCTSQKIDL